MDSLPKARKETECGGPLELYVAASPRGAPEASSDCVRSPGVAIPGEGDRTPVTVRGVAPLGAAYWKPLCNGTPIAQGPGVLWCPEATPPEAPAAAGLVPRRRVLSRSGASDVAWAGLERLRTSGGASWQPPWGHKEVTGGDRGGEGLAPVPLRASGVRRNAQGCRSRRVLDAGRKPRGAEGAGETRRLRGGRRECGALSGR